MEVRQMATAFLLNENKFLMIKKSGSRLFKEQFWSGLGGHLEPHELNSPRDACLREICEESGLKGENIFNLKLKYILLRIKDKEIRQQFVYFGETDQVNVVPSDEGEIYWIDIHEAVHLRMSAIIKFMMKHYLENPGMNDVLVGTITIDQNQEPKMQWAELKDPLIF